MTAGFNSQRAFISKIGNPKSTLAKAVNTVIVDGFIDESYRIKPSDIYSRLRPYWELRVPSALEYPRHSLTPLIAWDALLENKEPWFQTLYTQRGMNGRFREEIYFGCTAPADQTLDHLLSSLRVDTNSSCTAVQRLLAMRNQTEAPLRLALIARTLGALGYYAEAVELLNFTQKIEIDTIDLEYAASTWLYLIHVYNRVLLQSNAERIYISCPDRDESYRVKLSVANIALVDAARRKDMEAVRTWLVRTNDSLNCVLKSAEFSCFEKNLSISRVLRATSFYPFLIDDRQNLRKQAEECKKSAIDIVPQSALQEDLKLDNMYAMLETMSRIYEYLEEPDKAISYMEEIVSFDPFDCKAWMQVGDVRSRLGAPRETVVIAYKKAIKYGVPSAQLAAYKLGHIYEQMSDLPNALSAYIKAIRFDPFGISALERITYLAQELSEVQIRSWSKAHISKLGRLAEEN